MSINKFFKEEGFLCKCGTNATMTAKQLPNKILISFQCDKCDMNFSFEKPIQFYEDTTPKSLEQLEMTFGDDSVQDHS